MTIAFASAAPFRDLDDDLPLLLNAATQRGIDAEIANWDDPAVDWSAYDSVIVRSCWDYINRRDEFLAWTTSVSNLHNSHDVISWNTDKIYLRQLEAAGVPIIETRWDIAPGDAIGQHDEWVVKPTVSAGSKDTARWTSRDDVYAHSAELVAAGRTSMTQPYIASVDDEGETAMLFFGGAFSHAIRKGAILAKGEGVRQDRDGRGENPLAREPSDAQHAVAAQALAATDEILGRSAGLMYARVDLVTAADGSPLVIELELTEPSLFLPWSNGGAERLVDAIAKNL
ncbi:ATP-grasp domain-containing protein [Aeromicrobium sp.]|uniref:ATP-grasp domain-containing protein n=1 Tax=Aeromicrobium sp. TaxID=1871063 RepID=UPI002FC66D11